MKKINSINQTEKYYNSKTGEVLELMRNEKSPCTILLDGKEFVVFPNVFSPKYFLDTGYFSKNVPIKNGGSFLEMGCGAGVISIMAVYRGAEKVVAVDVNSEAVKNTKENIKKHKMEDKVDVYKSNVFSSVDKKKKFDVIFWNVPFGYTDNKNITLLERALSDPKYASIEKFLNEAKHYLTKNGRLFMGFSSTLGKINILRKMVDEAGLSLKLASETHSGQTSLEGAPVIKLEIFELLG